MAELTDKFCQYFGRLGQKKTEKKVWPSWLGRVGFGRVVWQSSLRKQIVRLLKGEIVAFCHRKYKSQF
jgi:hypothetical protein